MASSSSDVLDRSDGSLSPAQSLFLTMYDGNAPSPVLLGEATTAASENSPSSGPWGEGETRLLLNLYAHYSTKVGPMKKFRCKRAMYEYISKEILQILNIYRTPTQCESRFKTIAKRKKDEDTNNKTSGHSRCQVSYEEEFAAIRAADDSIQPEVLRGVHSVTYKTSQSAQGAKDPANILTGAANIPIGADCADLSGNSEFLDAPSSVVTDSAPKRKGTHKAGRPNAGRMMHMKYFFEHMQIINEEREAKREEREKRREERHQELLKLHREHIAALKDLAAKEDNM
ncbi:hypothetical protein HPB49_002375 [Dermacentor silvarum]|uniref:Uncharacterized protein n=2 Tax=Dermacentor silvarum TaxID=543639 RepID=A0ACB8DMG0_DERSI|nr:uncharacterized protein LOC119431691 [Dermacentor silvarum]XP_037572273.1 uncharacterized protein LOC119454398 [Dermacentor silvarum]KAH7948983.1 hypothetical protein HPB49_003846 [Dermacentor silvarum]KAH7973556.1 hypothetical protein HPB49_002375 [Dermacentor silvarum]